MKKTLVFKDNFAFLYLNKKIYSSMKIKEALFEFKDFIKPSISELGDYTVVKIEQINLDYTLKELAHEFANFVLSKEKRVSQ